jgi:hypothetical protein
MSRTVSAMCEFTQRYADRFRMASLGLSGFTTMRCLRGFDQSMLDMAYRPDRIRWLADLVFDFEERLVAELPPFHFDAVSFYDDRGTQRGMIIAPRTWRESCLSFLTSLRSEWIFST